MSTLQVFQVKKMSIAEILYIAGSDICSAGAEYIKHGKNLRAAWDALRDNDIHHRAILVKIKLPINEPAFPDELYKDFAKYFEPVKMPMKKIRGLIDNITELKYDHLRKKHKSSKDLDHEFKRFCFALERFVNNKARDRSITAW